MSQAVAHGAGRVLLRGQAACQKERQQRNAKLVPDGPTSFSE